MLTVFEIYPSIQGESTYTGRPCVFVRLAACNLRCEWCDTAYAFSGGTKMTVDQVRVTVQELGCRLVEVTGGEPLLQPDAIPLMTGLLEDGCEVLLETGGHMPIDEVPDQVVRIVDVKCPGSGEADRMHWPNLDRLTSRDEVKFVVRDRADFEYAIDVVDRYALDGKVGAILFSPVFGVLDPADLAAWIVGPPETDHLRQGDGGPPKLHAKAEGPGLHAAGDRRRSRSIRLQLQAHKYIWEPATRGV